MKKINIAGYTFIPFEEFLKERFKDKSFRKGYLEKLAKLRLAHQIAVLRRKKRMTQKQVAEKAGMPQSVIARIESGRHSFSIATLHKIAGVFDTRIALVSTADGRR